MTRLNRLAGLALACALAAPLAAHADERVVFVRHGEKPELGLGQLNCQGLNRALALPGFIAKTFGRIDAIFAANPSVQKPDRGVPYDYVRPLITIEPTAITLGLPVQTRFGFDDPKGLEAALTDKTYANATVVVAWEHRVVDVIARDLLAAHGGDAGQVPTWDDADFDGVYVVTLPADGPARFQRLVEGLDGQPDACSH